MSNLNPRALHDLLFDHAEGLSAPDVARSLEIDTEEARSMLAYEAEHGAIEVVSGEGTSRVYRTKLRVRPPRRVRVLPASKPARRAALHKTISEYKKGLTREEIAFQMGCDYRTAHELIEEEVGARSVSKAKVAGKTVYRVSAIRHPSGRLRGQTIALAVVVAAALAVVVWLLIP